MNIQYKPGLGENVYIFMYKENLVKRNRKVLIMTVSTWHVYR